MTRFDTKHLLQKEMTRKEFIGFSIFTVLSVFGIVGVLRQLGSHAATPTASVEPEAGTVAQGAVKKTDATASGGMAVQFGAAAAGVRPSGAHTVRYEDLYVNGDTLQQTINRTPAGKLLTFPAGVFEFSDFNGSDGSGNVGITIPTGILGIAGSGRGSLTGGEGTIFRMRPNSSTKASRVPAQSVPNSTNQLYLMKVSNSTDQIFQHFHLEGTEQGHYYNGFMLMQCTRPVLSDLFVNGHAGNWNSPPGETFGINVFRGSGMIGNRVECDGRRADGVRYGASPFGYNSTSDSTLNDCYMHHSSAGMFTYWQTVNCVSNNLRCEYQGVGSSPTYGHGINHERSGNITHNNPKIIIDRPAGNMGYHVTWNNDQSAYAGFLKIVNPTWDVDQRGPVTAGFPKGRFIVMSFALELGNPNLYRAGTPYVPKVYEADGTTPLAAFLYGN